MMIMMGMAEMTDSNVITWNECRKVTSRLLNENDDSEFKRMIDTDKEIKYYTEIINGEYRSNIARNAVAGVRK